MQKHKLSSNDKITILESVESTIFGDREKSIKSLQFGLWTKHLKALGIGYTDKGVLHKNTLVFDPFANYWPTKTTPAHPSLVKEFDDFVDIYQDFNLQKNKVNSLFRRMFFIAKTLKDVQALLLPHQQDLYFTNTSDLPLTLTQNQIDAFRSQNQNELEYLTQLQFIYKMLG